MVELGYRKDSVEVDLLKPAPEIAAASSRGGGARTRKRSRSAALCMSPTPDDRR
jgi:hypothetical protein